MYMNLSHYITPILFRIEPQMNRPDIMGIWSATWTGQAWMVLGSWG